MSRPGKNKKASVLKNSVVLLVEGETEVEFYKLLLAEIIKERIQKSPKRFADDFKIEKPVNMKGISKFQRNAIVQFDFLMKQNAKKYTDIDFEYHVFVCIDTDVFLYEQNPPLNKEKLKKELEDAGAYKVTFIEAEESIEDWFLCDIDGIRQFLKLKTISSGYKRNQKGADKLNAIFEQAGKSYVKGCNARGFIEQLDIEKIIQKNKSKLSELIDLFK